MCFTKDIGRMQVVSISIFVFQVCSRENLRSLVLSISFAALYMATECFAHHVRWHFMVIRGANAFVMEQVLTLNPCCC